MNIMIGANAVMATCCIPVPVLSADPPAAYNVVFDSPSKDFHGAMPLGNGDIGASVWTEGNGDLLFYVAKTDSYDDNARLLKLGLVRVTLSPNPFAHGQPYRQELSLANGELLITTGTNDNAVTLRVWVDACLPVIRVEATSQRPLEARAVLESWRTQERNINADLSHSDPLRGGPWPTIQYPDTILGNQKNRIAWYHHNARSAWPITMKLQGLESLIPGMTDPLLDRVFGGAIWGEGWISKNTNTLKTAKPTKQIRLCVQALTRHPVKPEEWLKALDQDTARITAVKWDAASAAHRDWWHDFWNRSHVRVSSAGDAALAGKLQEMSRGYALQRYLVACGGRGDMWIKFNGSILSLIHI